MKARLKFPESQEIIARNPSLFHGTDRSDHFSLLLELSGKVALLLVVLSFSPFIISLGLLTSAFTWRLQAAIEIQPI